MTDPVVDEVRRIRKEIWAKFDNDPKKYFEHLASLDTELRAQGFIFADDLKPKAKE